MIGEGNQSQTILDEEGVGEDTVEEIVEEIVEETEVNEDVEEVYDPMGDLINRKMGVQCPNCKDRVFPGPETVRCRCEIMYVVPDNKCLRFFVGAPYTSADAKVISERVEPGEFAEGELSLAQQVEEELGEITNDAAEELDEVIDREYVTLEETDADINNSEVNL